jgi:stage II sporulation protein M
MQRFIQSYRDLFEQNRVWIRMIWNWFILAAFVGGVVAVVKPEFLQSIAASFAERFGANPALDINLAMQILLQNITASLVALFGGLLLGLGSILVVVVNGFLIGFIISSLLFSGINILGWFVVVLGGLVPHGIFEIPAFLLAAALGLRLGTQWMRSESKGQRGEVFKKSLIQALVGLPAIALALLLAAIIEVFVSGNIVNSL